MMLFPLVWALCPRGLGCIDDNATEVSCSSDPASPENPSLAQSQRRVPQSCKKIIDAVLGGYCGLPWVSEGCPLPVRQYRQELLRLHAREVPCA
eukprot:3633613-Rhodomonas_salina.1